MNAIIAAALIVGIVSLPSTFISEEEALSNPPIENLKELIRWESNITINNVSIVNDSQIDMAFAYLEFMNSEDMIREAIRMFESGERL
ncbi:MAG TPA: hypothetical protein EYP28_06175 [Methanophagales archaeon]|nr:hypothetical protein [Methanophagales archaeon]